MSVGVKHYWLYLLTFTSMSFKRRTFIEHRAFSIASPQRHWKDEMSVVLQVKADEEQHCVAPPLSVVLLKSIQKLFTALLKVFDPHTKILLTLIDMQEGNALTTASHCINTGMQNVLLSPRQYYSNELLNWTEHRQCSIHSSNSKANTLFRSTLRAGSSRLSVNVSSAFSLTCWVTDSLGNVYWQKIWCPNQISPKKVHVHVFADGL